MRKKILLVLLIGISFLVLAFFVPSISEAQISPSVSLSADPISVPSGGSTILTWWTNAIDACVASGGWSGDKSLPSGSETILNITSDTTFTLTCYNVFTPGSDSVTVTVTAPPPPPGPCTAPCNCNTPVYVDCPSGWIGTTDTCPNIYYYCCCPPATCDPSTQWSCGANDAIFCNIYNTCVDCASDWRNCDGVDGCETSGSCVAPPPTTCTGEVILYENINYGGDCISFSVGEDNDLRDDPGPCLAASCTTISGSCWHDCASSIRVSSGYTAILYENPGFGLPSLPPLTADDPTLVDDGWNDRASSIQVTAGPAPPPPGGWIRIENPLTADTFGDLIDKLINFIFTIAIVLAPLMIIIAGFLFVTSGGKPEQVAKAKTIITWTIIGFIIILLAKGIVALIDQILGVS